MSEQFDLRVRLRPEDGPIEPRLRMWLKLGLRRFGIRVVENKELPREEEEEKSRDDQ